MTGRSAPVPLLLGRRETTEDESEKDAMFSIVRSRSGQGSEIRIEGRIVWLPSTWLLLWKLPLESVAWHQGRALLCSCTAARCADAGGQT